MIQDTTSLRIDLGISAQKLAQQVYINNRNIEQHIEKGLELALEEIFDEENFVDMVKEAAKTDIKKLVSETILSWEMKKRIRTAIENKVYEKVDAFSEEIAKKLIESTNGLI